MPKFERLSKLHKYGAAISFLAMEIFALIAFSFGGSFVLYGSLSLALAVLLIIFNIREITVDGISSIALFFLPLFLFTVITALGVYMRSHAYVGHFSNAELIFIPLGLLPMSFAGYVLSIDKTFKISIFLIVIYGALSVLSIVNLIVNFVNFGAFYTIIYKGYHMYYGGSLAEVTVDKLAYVLEGFKFIEVRIERYNLFPTLLLTSIIALLFLSPKKERKLFVIYSAFAGVAVLSLVFIPSLNGLFCALTVLLITAVIFLLKKFEIFTNPERASIKKALKVTGIVVLVLGSLFFLGLLLNNQSKIPFVHNITSSNSLLNRIFNSNRFVNAINPLMTDVLCSDRFLGYVVTDSIFQEAIPLSGSFYFDTFMTSGVIGLAAIIFALVIGLKGFKNYLSKENDNFYVKAILLTITIFYLIYIGIFNVSEYGIFYSIYQPSFISGPFMIIIFILSYALAKGGIKEKVIETAKESLSISEEEEINE